MWVGNVKEKNRDRTHLNGLLLRVVSPFVGYSCLYSGELHFALFFVHCASCSTEVVGCHTRINYRDHTVDRDTERRYK